MDGRRLAEQIERLCSADSYIAGGVAINREGPRFSGDIDIFDAKALTAAGLKVSWGKIQSGKRQAEVEGRGPCGK